MSQKIDYPYIPENRQMEYVPEDNVFMKEAQKACLELSTDKNHPNGAVLVKDGQIIARGANQSALKNEKLIQLHKNGFCIRRVLGIPSGQRYWLCVGCASSSNHSEAMVIKNAKKNKQNTTNADLYFWGHWWCCQPCWQEMEKAEIANVYLLENSHILFNKTHPDNVVGK